MTAITYVYADGQVEVHRAGCKDVARKAGRATTVYDSEATTESEAARFFWIDFIEEGSMSERDAILNTRCFPCVELAR